MYTIDVSSLAKKAYIGAKFIDTEASFAVLNPYSGKLFAEAADCKEIEAKAALDSALDSFKTWKKSSVKDRALALKSWAFEIRSHKESIARILSSEQGKVYAEALGEVEQGAVMIDWFSEEARRIHGETLSVQSDSKRDFTVKTPVGVVLLLPLGTFHLSHL